MKKFLIFISGFFLAIFLFILIFWKVIYSLFFINNLSYYPINTKNINDNIIKSIIATSNDDYSNYFNKEESKELMQDLNNEMVGLGIKYTNQDKVKILEVIKNSPAQKAGLKINDIIYKIDGKIFDAKKAPDLLKGKKGEIKKITINRNNVKKEFKIKINNFENYSIEAKKINNKGYLKISSISDDTYNEMKKELSKLEKDNIKELIIDLRNNPGGYTTIAQKIVNEFLYNKDKPIVTFKSKNGKKEIFTNKKVERKKYNIDILINENTASAAEIIAIALKDLGDYKLIGQKTYGKGSAQTIIPLPDKSLIKITSEIWYGPNNEIINKKGISPDINIKNSKDFWSNQYSFENDLQLKEALK